MANVEATKRSHAVAGAIMDKVDRNIANAWGECMPCVVEHKLRKRREEGQQKLCLVAERREERRHQWCVKLVLYSCWHPAVYEEWCC
jgi:hypothetical protein